FKAFQVTADVPKIYMQEFWATAKLHHNSIQFKIDTRKSVLDLEAFKEMLHISPRIPNQPFADLPTEEEILDFLTFLGHSYDICYLMDVNVNKLYQPWRSFALVINKCLTSKSSGVDTPTPVEPTDVQRTEAEQLKIVLKRSKQETYISQQSGSGTDEGTDVERTEAEQLKITLKRSGQETHASQQRGSGTDEGTSSRSRVPDVPSDDSEEELSWNSYDDEEGDEQTKGREESEGDKTDE
nr:hypothetical protein [Tanacetum cinerariifolium]